MITPTRQGDKSLVYPMNRKRGFLMLVSFSTRKRNRMGSLIPAKNVSSGSPQVGKKVSKS